MAKVQHITNVARRKKVRRRLHRGRVAGALAILALIVVGIVLAFSTDECESPLTHQHVNAEAVAAASIFAAAAAAFDCKMAMPFIKFDCFCSVFCMTCNAWTACIAC